MIAEARAVLADPVNPKRSVKGRVVPTPTPYNPGWTFHLDPATIQLFEMDIEVCDADGDYVQEHLDEVGGAFLPKSVWCPWSSVLIREVEQQPT